MKRALIYGFVLVMTGFGRAEDVALVVGIGDVRIARETETPSSDDVPVWDRMSRPEARREAEAAFRELVPSALREPYLYARVPRWYEDGFNGFKPAVLLTDGFTDNAYLPVASRILGEMQRLAKAASGQDDFVLFVVGMGEANAWESILYDRLNNPIKLATLVDAMPSSGGRGRRLLLARIYPTSHAGPPTTLMIADDSSCEQLGRWFQTAQRQVAKGKPATSPNRIFPGLPVHRGALTPMRLNRLGARLLQAAGMRNGLKMLDLGQAMEPMRQEVKLAVKVEEKKIFKKVRRAGPLFTIIEEDSDELDRIERNIDRPAILEQLAKANIASSTSRGFIEELEESLADSFEKSVTFSGVGYQLKFDKPAGVLRVTYDD